MTQQPQPQVSSLTHPRHGPGGDTPQRTHQLSSRAGLLPAFRSPKACGGISSRRKAGISAPASFLTPGTVGGGGRRNHVCLPPTRFLGFPPRLYPLGACHKLTCSQWRRLVRSGGRGASVPETPPTRWDPSRQHEPRRPGTFLGGDSPRRGGPPVSASLPALGGLLFLSRALDLATALAGAANMPQQVCPASARCRALPRFPLFWQGCLGVFSWGSQGNLLGLGISLGPRDIRGSWSYLWVPGVFAYPGDIRGPWGHPWVPGIYTWVLGDIRGSWGTSVDPGHICGSQGHPWVPGTSMGLRGVLVAPAGPGDICGSQGHPWVLGDVFGSQRHPLVLGGICESQRHLWVPETSMGLRSVLVAPAGPGAICGSWWHPPGFMLTS